MSSRQRQTWIFLPAVICYLLIICNSAADTIRTPIRYGIEQDIPLHAAYDAFVDWDGDGRIDIVSVKITDVSHYKQGVGGWESIVYFCKNIGTKENPKFLSPISTKTPTEFYDEIKNSDAFLLKVKGFAGIAVTDWNEDGKYDILIGQKEGIRVFLNMGTRKKPQLEEEEVFKFKNGERIKGKLCVADWDMDGRKDLIFGANSPEPYCKGDRFIRHSRDMYNEMCGRVYFCKNVGTNERPEFNSIEMLKVKGKPIKIFGSPKIQVVDWDKDGDQDLICCTDKGGRVLYFERIDTDTSYILSSPVNLKADGKEIKRYYDTHPIVLDLDSDGDKDLIIRSSWYEYYENTGTAGNPQLHYRGHLMQAGSKDSILTCDCIITPTVVDWDGDGDSDFIVGNEPGFISFIENIGNDTHRKFLPPVYLKYANGKTIQMFAKDTGGSCWGPVEDYDERTSPVVCDWDNDGDLDILTGTMGRHVYYFKNAGTRKRPRLAKEVRVQFNGKDLKTLQRTRPGIVDWDGDGVIDLILPDDGGCVRYYKGKIVRGKKILTGGVILKTCNYQALMPNKEIGTWKEGRTQYEIVDWDNDGDWDILVGFHAMPAKVMYYKNIGTNAKPLFEAFVLIPDPRSGHSPGIDTFDWNKDGVKDIIIGNQEGQIFWCDGRQFKDVGAVREISYPPIKDSGKLKSAVITKTLSPPVIDGNLNDACWQKAVILKDFVLTTGKNLAFFKTKISLTYDDNNLYLGIQRLESKGKELTANFKEHDSSIWKDDSVEIFLDTNHDRKSFYQLVVNSIGAAFDLKVKSSGEMDKSWDPLLQVKTKVNDDRWFIEICIPFKELGIPTPKSGDMWGFNIVSNRKGANQKSSQWCCTYGNNHAPERFGEIVFGK